MTALLTADWDPYGDNKYFRKVEIYEMGWSDEVNLDNAIVIPSRFGGPIAVIRDRIKPGRTALKGIGKPTIGIYSSSGQLISSFVWNSGQLIKLGWSSSEELLCIQENGEVLRYSIFGKYIHAFRMGQEVEDTKVIDARVFHTAVGSGVCVLTGAYRIFLTNSITDIKIRKLVEIPGKVALQNSWAVVFEERLTFVLLSKSTELYYVSEAQVIQKSIDGKGEERGSIITDIAVSPCNKHVALYNSQEQLWIGSSNLREHYRTLDMRNSSRPSQLVWCGSEAVVGCWDEYVLVIGRTEERLQYIYDYPIKLVPEIDSVRVISSYTTDIIQPVPTVILELYHLHSTSPGSYLYEASKQFQKKSHRADEYIRMVKPQLRTAINQCIRAASHEFKPENQKTLMKAAQFGKTFADYFDPDEYVKMCRTLRVLNAVRDPKIGIFLTYPQFEHCTLKNLLDRLITRRLYCVAIEAAKYMRLSNEEGSTRILEHWAFYKVSQLDSDKEQTAKEIANKLGRTSGVSYIEVAKKAIKFGRNKLAVKLIDYEPRAALQVALLLDMEKYAEALDKAVDSGDTDLISVVIVTMQRKMPMKDFQMEVRKESTVYALYKKHCHERNTEALMNIYKQEDDNNEVAACHIRNAFDSENYSMRNTYLDSAKDSYRKARNEVNLILCDEQKKLSFRQKELEEKFKRNFLDLSLQDTVYRLLMLEQFRLAEDMQIMYQMSDRKFWRLKIEALAELRDWIELDRFSKLRKSPIGYEPFIDVCLKHDKKDEAKKYIGKVREENKIKYLIKLKLFSEAIKLAELQQDADSLQLIRANGNTIVKQEVEDVLAKMNNAS